MVHRRTLLLLVLLTLAFCISACDSSTEAPVDGDSPTDGDSDGDVDGDFTLPDSFSVLVSPDAPKAVKLAADDVVALFAQAGLQTTQSEGTDAPACSAGQVTVVLIGDGLGEADETVRETDQTFRMVETRCGNGALVELSGGGLLGRQYAVYEWLHKLGFRFFHPEQTYIPDSLQWPDDPLEYTHTPDFKYRSVSLHLTHPLALGDAFKYNDPEQLPEARRYIDWQIHNGASSGHEGYGDGETKTYGLDRGFPDSTGFSLYNQQQGASNVIDYDDPRPVNQQITDAIDERMGDDPANYPDIFGFTFNPTEFTEIEDTVAVEQLTLIADYMADNYPDTLVQVINHGTYGDPTENYGVRYYDLPKFAPENLGVKVHTLMFYDLFRPAPMYGNDDFSMLYDFMESEYQTRELWYFPESAWWLTFDNQLPVYLPITIEARDRDIQGIKHMLAGKLNGHHVFGSGHEWGYWQNEYCSFRMSMDVSYRYTDCLADIASPMGAAKDEVVSVLSDAIDQQEGEWIYGDILRYLVGSDPETEAAASLGIRFHPMPPSPAEIMNWTAKQCEDWHTKPGAQLQAAADDYAALVARLDAVRELVPETGLPWFDEIYDGLAINGLRAKHQYEVFAAIVTHRQSQLELDDAKATQAKELLAAAQASTENARSVIERREQGYRYHPLSRYIGGGPDCNADENWSSYAYRVHCRTHTVFYWKRIDGLVADQINAVGQAATFGDVVIPTTQPLTLDIIDPALGEVNVDFGDGQSEAGTNFSHSYATAGVYTVTITGKRDGEDFSQTTSVAVLQSEQATGYTGKLTQPDGIDIIEPVMPSVAFGLAGTDKPVVGFSASSDASVVPGEFVVLAPVEGSDAAFAGTATSINVPIIQKSDDSIIAHVVIGSATANWTGGDTPLIVSGNMAVDSIVAAVVVVGAGAFDEDGARKLIASFLGYTPETLPATVPFVIEYTLGE